MTKHKINLSNIVVPIISPKTRAEFCSLIDFVIGSGVKDILLFGTTGEGKKMSLNEKKSLIRTLIPHVAGRAHLHVALLCANLDEAIDLGNFCETMGVTSGLFPPILYSDDVAAALETFVKKCALPSCIYNPPGQKRVPNEKILPWVNRDRIIGVKDSLCSLAELEDLIKRCKSPTFKVYYGKDSELKEAISLGIDGLMSGTATADPKLFLDLWQKRDDASFERLKQLKARIEQLGGGDRIKGLKALLKEAQIIQNA